MFSRILFKTKGCFGNKKMVTFNSFLSSYIVIMLICLSISTIVAIYSFTNLKKEVISSYTATSSLLQTKVDSNISSLIQFSSNLNQTISTFKEASKQDVCAILNELIAFNNFVDACYIYLPSENLFITPHGVMSDKYVYITYYSSPDYSFDDFKKYIKNVPVQDLAIVNASINNTSVKCLSYVSPYKIENGEIKGSLICLSNSKKIFFDTVLPSKPFVSFFSTYNNKIFYSNNNNVTDKLNDKFSDISDIFKLDTVKINNSKYILNITQSAATPAIKYINMIPCSFFSDTLLNAIIVFVVCFTLSILLGLIVSFIYAKRNYTLIENVLDLLKDKTEKKSALDDYNDITNMLRNLLTTYSDMKIKLNYNNQTLKNLLIQNLLCGYLNENVIFDLLKNDFNFNLNNSGFNIIVFKALDFSNLFPSEKKYKTDPQALVSFIIKNVAQEVYSEKFTIQLIDYYKFTICILNCNESDKNEIYSLTKRITDFFETQMLIILTAVISSNQNNFSNVAFTFNQCVSFFEYCTEGGTYFYNTPVPDINSNLVFSAANENDLINIIKTGNLEEAESTFNKIIYPLKHNKSSIESTKCFMFNIATSLSRNFDDEVFESIECSIIKLMRKIQIAVDHYDLDSLMKSVILNITAYYKSKRIPANKISDKVIIYIKNNFHDSLLDITSVGEYFDKSPAYISRIFKEETNITLNNFITDIRINAAIDYLSTTDLSIKSIADKVGYSNSNILINNFKKRMGVTPMAYKDSLS